MRTLIFSALAAACLFLKPSAAEETFALADVALFGNDRLTVSLAASSQDTAESVFQILGTIVDLEEGRTTPLEVTVPSDLTLKNALTGATETGLKIIQRNEHKVKISTPTINKTIYSISEENTGSIILTDDPSPLAVVVLTAAVIIVVQGTIDNLLCEGTFERNIKPSWKPPFVESESKCIPAS